MKKNKNDKMKKILTNKQTHETTELLGCLKNDDNYQEKSHITSVLIKYLPLFTTY